MAGGPSACDTSLRQPRPARDKARATPAARNPLCMGDPENAITTLAAGGPPARRRLSRPFPVRPGWSLGPVRLREADREGADAGAVLLPHLDVGAVVDAAVEPRQRRLVPHGLELRAG